MDSAWIGAISALGGVTVAAVAEGLRSRASFRREKGWLLYEERRERLEHSYEALEQLRESYGQAYIQAIHVVGTQTLPASQIRTAIPWSRLRMLVHLYVPELVNQLQDVELTGRNLGSALGKAVMESSLDVARNQHLITHLDRAFQDLNAAVDHMRNAIVARSGALAAEAAREAGNFFNVVRPR